MAKRRACVVKFCRLLRSSNSLYCSVHSVFSPETLQDESLQLRIAQALDRSVPFAFREMMKLYTGLGDGYIYTTQQISRIFSSSNSAFSPTPARVRRVLRRVADVLRPVLLSAADESHRGEIVTVSRELLRELAGRPHQLYALSPRAFEQLVADIFGRFGFEVELTRQSVDGGKDIIAVSRDKLGIPTSYLVECKRYTPPNKVGVGIARAVYGVKCANGTDHAIVATTSWFTPHAVEFARDVVNLHLRDFEDVCGWLRRSGGAELRLEDTVKSAQVCRAVEP